MQDDINNFFNSYVKQMGWNMEFPVNRDQVILFPVIVKN